MGQRRGSSAPPGVEHVILYIYKSSYAVCPAGGNMICGKCRMEGVAPSKMCATVESVRIHYSTGNKPSKPKKRSARKG